MGGEDGYASHREEQVEVFLESVLLIKGAGRMTAL
jgi:hypothetical protein